MYRLKDVSEGLQGIKHIKEKVSSWCVIISECVRLMLKYIE